MAASEAAGLAIGDERVPARIAAGTCFRVGAGLGASPGDAANSLILHAVAGAVSLTAVLSDPLVT